MRLHCRHLNETGMANPDNAEDFRLGVLCNDGEFEPRASNTWPEESRCVEVSSII